jgi:hypothetical protein
MMLSPEDAIGPDQSPASAAGTGPPERIEPARTFDPHSCEQPWPDIGPHSS